MNESNNNVGIVADGSGAAAGVGGGVLGSGGAGGSVGADGGVGVVDFSTLLDREGNFTRKDWAGEGSRLGEKIKDIRTLARVHETLERLNSSGQKIALPGEHAGDDEWGTFYGRLGRPESAEGYEVSVPEGLREKGVPVDDAGLKEFKEVAHKAGLTPKQVSAVADYYFKSVEGVLGEVAQAGEAAVEAAVLDLEKDFGPRGSKKWTRELALVRHGARTLGLDEEELSSNPQLGNNPQLIRALRRAAELSSEPVGSAVQSEGGLGGGVEGRLAAIMNDPGHPYRIADHPGHKAAVAQVQELFKLQASGL